MMSDVVKEPGMKEVMEVRSSQQTLSLDSCEGMCEPHTFMVGLCVL